MRYAVIDPQKRTLRAIDASSFDVALDVAGLADVGRDHGLVNRSLGIVVHEYGLYEPPDQQHYFALGSKLFAGKALLYAFDERGKTIDLTQCPEPVFFASPAAVEEAIDAGQIERPMKALNGRIVWQWSEQKQ